MRNHLGRPAARLRAEGGYTLTELLVVMAVIGLLAAVITPGLTGHLGRARVKTAQIQLETLAAGVESFRTDVGRYPARGEGLAALLSEPSGAEGWTGPYIKNGRQLKDPWGFEIRYEPREDGTGFFVNSYGSDGRAEGSGTAKDLQAPQG